MKRPHPTALLLAVAAIAICVPQSGADEIELSSQSCEVLQFAAASSLEHSLRPYKKFESTPDLDETLQQSLETEISWREAMIDRLRERNSSATSATKRSARKLVDGDADEGALVDAAAECLNATLRTPESFQERSCRQKFNDAYQITRDYISKHDDGYRIVSFAGCHAAGLSTSECMEIASFSEDAPGIASLLWPSDGKDAGFDLEEFLSPNADADAEFDVFSTAQFGGEQAELRRLHALVSEEPFPIPYIRSARQCLRDALDE